ncbi:MAG TPA: hypothetical protein VE505_11195, partial [Vicinamibacterales bacterium]|nr:hypothetical protein [Vicinamibacterales bacterium]
MIARDCRLDYARAARFCSRGHAEGGVAGVCPDVQKGHRAVMCVRAGVRTGAQAIGNDAANQVAELLVGHGCTSAGSQSTRSTIPRIA